MDQTSFLGRVAAGDPTVHAYLLSDRSAFAMPPRRSRARNHGTRLAQVEVDVR
jgi:hypothetical protein